MTDEDVVRHRIRALILEMAPEQPADDSDPDPLLVETLGYYSLSMLELAFALEDEYDLPPIDQETASRIRRASDIEDYVINQLRQHTTNTD
ncbi:hypothetical protein [Lentzea sp. NPDC004782]|uniref:hypothetical protein n=1 Tax=Lentzea sp. NPDC004782 TaxID=3154458 RepID=UPI0033B371CB